MAGATDTGQPAGWQCCCGNQGNQGNFCAVCGRPRPAQALYQYAYPAESGNGNRKVKLALICVIVVLAAVLVFLVVRENTLGADADSSTYSVVSKQKKAAVDKAAAAATAKTASPSAPAADSARSELSLGGVDLGLTVDDMRRILGPEDSSKTQDGMILYNYPGRMGVQMGREFLDRVGRSRNIVGIKESSGDINRVHLLARDYPHVQLSCGMDDQALEFFAWGARSWICAGSNFLPAEHIALYDACVRRGDFDRGRRIMSAMLPLMAVLEQGGKFIQCVKHGVQTTGLHAGPMRPPLRGLNKDEKRALEQVIRTLKTTVAAITEGN